MSQVTGHKSTSHLIIKNLHATVEKKEILKGISLSIKSGEIHAIMGPNGSGKSTLCNVLMGHPKYEVTKGQVLLDKENILDIEADKRAQKGLFLSFQYPQEIPGISYANFLRTAKNALLIGQGKKPMSVMEFATFMKEKMKMLDTPEDFRTRSVNEGFSGGEKKRAEILQMAILEPLFGMLDETDSGLDIDALRTVARGAAKIAKENNMGILLITHYQRILKYIKPDFIHIMINGKIVKSGGHELVEKLEEKGYEQFQKLNPTS
ncbi:MAG: Fe-S cluster assembly ATPase SufC [Patescibacteria group bacterium]|mgnify:FL=1